MNDPAETVRKEESVMIATLCACPDHQTITTDLQQYKYVYVYH